MARETDTSSGDEKKYTWELENGKCTCSVSEQSHQFVWNLWEAVEPRVFHDATLIEATRRINKILREAAGKCPDPERELCFIEFADQPMLVWSKTMRGGLLADDDPRTVADALGLDASEL